MSRCQKCYTELPDGARFCGVCGFAQLPVETFSAPLASAADVTVEAAVKVIPDTPPLSPAVSLKPTRTVHPGFKQAALPEGAGSASLRPPGPEPSQKTVGEAEASTILGQREPARDMIPETPKPSEDIYQFGPSNVPEMPEPGPIQKMGQLIRPATPLPALSEGPESQGQEVKSTSSSQAQFRDSATAASAGTSNPPAAPVISVPVVKSVQFKSRVWPSNPGLSEQPQPDAAGTLDVTNRPGILASHPGQAPDLLRPVGFSPSSIHSVEPSAPVQPGRSVPVQGGPIPMQPENMPALPPTMPPPASPGLPPQQNFAPAYSVAQGPAQNWQRPAEQEPRQQGESGSASFPWQRSGVTHRAAGQTQGAGGSLHPVPEDAFALSEADLGRFGSTSKAAEHWRQSWRDRQRAEAGPAEGVSRGQAAVPMPLMAMQQSLARMRAIILANKERDQRPQNLGFWIPLLLMLCLIVGLGAYIISSYIPTSPYGAARVVPPVEAAQPSLAAQGAQSSAIVVGQSVHVHGEHFAANDPIDFLLDTTQPIADASGRNISAQTNDQGAFDATIPIGSDWTTGTHVIQAVDNHSNQFAYLTIDVRPAGTPVDASSNLALTLNGQPLHEIALTAVVGKGNPSQRFTLSNTSGTPLKWSATTVVGNNLSWLVINDNHTYGNLDISGTDSIGISAIITGLESSKQPYKGQIIFTINDSEQLTLPVQLMVNDAPAELIFSPDPIIAHFVSGGICQTGQNGASLTLINLGEQVISWKLGMDGNTASHLHFSSVQGTLAPSDQSTPQFSSTQVLTLKCVSVQIGGSYTITLYANGAQWPEQVFIQS